jgi:hypothetical protein
MPAFDTHTCIHSTIVPMLEYSFLKPQEKDQAPRPHAISTIELCLTTEAVGGALRGL